MDSGYRAVRYESRVVGRGCVRTIDGVDRGIVVRRDRICNEEFVSVGELFNQAANTSGVVDRCRKRLGEGDRRAACSGLNGVQRKRVILSRYAVGGVECIRYVPICAQG